MYTAMGFMPKNSLLLIDEGSAHLSSRLGSGVAITRFSEMNLKGLMYQITPALPGGGERWQMVFLCASARSAVTESDRKEPAYAAASLEGTEPKPHCRRHLSQHS